jgi:hypothetical protein
MCKDIQDEWRKEGSCLGQPEAKPTFFKRRTGNVYRLLG